MKLLIIIFLALLLSGLFFLMFNIISKSYFHFGVSEGYGEGFEDGYREALKDSHK